MDLGVLLLRLVIGALLVGHGTQKLFGWFGGSGLTGTAKFFEAVGFRPGRPNAIVAGLSECGAGLLIALGLLTPLGGAMAAGTLIVAGSVNAKKGLWATNGGYELPLVYAVIGACLAFIGPGAYSLDQALGLTARWGVASGLVALVLAVVGSGGFLAVSRRRAA